MNEKAVQQVLQGMALGQILLPRLIDIVTHYAELQNDPALKETDREKMVANLQSMQLADWKDL